VRSLMASGEALPDSVEYPDSQLAVGTRHHDHELFAAPAADEVDVAKRPAHRQGEASERPIPGFVAVLVVELLEEVEIRDCKRERRLLPKKHAHLVLERTPVHKSG